MMRGLVRVGLLILAACVAAPAARATVFSRDGYGWWWDQGDPIASGRGGTSVAVAGYGATGEVNPATTALASLTYGYGAWVGEIASVKGDAGKFRQRSDLLPHIGGVIVLPRGLRVMGLLRAQTDATYERTQHFDASAAGPFDLETKGDGGWNRLEIGLSGPALDSRLLWGGAVSRIMGSAKEAWTYRFSDASSALIRQQIDARLSGGWMGTAGIVAIPDPRLSLGASATLGGSSRVTQEVRAVEGGAFTVSTHGHQDFPSQWALGAQARFTPRAALSADLVRTLWGSAAWKPGAGGAVTHPWDSATRWGIGLEYAAAVAPNAAAPRLPRWTARTGFAHDQYYVSTSDGHRVNENGVTLGASARGGHGRSSIDFGIEIGSRGKLAQDGVAESFYRLSIGITYSSAVREY